MSDRFIATEPLDKNGEAGEKLVWEAIKTAFADRDCLAYWRYPIFSGVGKFRKEPDILIADRELGLIIIEVKSIAIEQIVTIDGHRWQYQNFYTTFGNPYQQAENQLFALLEYCDREPNLKKQITAKAIIALPLIPETKWIERKFDRLPSNPPIIFKNYLRSSVFICGLIKKIPPVTTGDRLTQKQWQLLLAVLAGTPIYRQPTRPIYSHSQSRGAILQKLRSHINELDIQQEKIGKEIPPGCQRIRGIAGSGKTAILCQKAAHMHLKHPHWKIALVFFSRSLYHPMREQLDRWLQYFSNNQQKYDPKNRNLLVLHAWGGRQRSGLYSLLCEITGIKPLTASELTSKQPNEALAEACLKLLETSTIPQIFDAILIDEGQDLVADNFKYKDKQPFYWLADRALRSADTLHPEQKRLIWAYDEAQSLESAKIPTASELFGEELGHLVTGKHPGGINKSEIMSCCYRTPHQILTVAHAIGMGLLRPGGMLTGITRAEEWSAIGYQVTGNFRSGRQITIQRPPQNSPNPICELWQGELIELQSYSSRIEELSALSDRIIHNLKYDGLRPSREILVIVLGSGFEAMQLETQVAKFLLDRGIDIYIPSSSDCNLLSIDRHNYHPDRFWYEGAVTVSRIHRAKGHEADMVYLVGLDRIARAENKIGDRNQLFVALTRSRAWVSLSGIGSYPFYEEIHRAIKSGDRFTFTYRPPQREIKVTDAGELLNRYAKGGRNFQNVNLENAQLAGVCLKGANLISANLRNANLKGAQLDGVKLIIADLRDANLSGANLRGANLMGAILENANLSDTDLTNANLSDANLTNTKLSGAILDNANLTGVNLENANF
ncbi:MAG: pentapeptide repeat-containing protein [Xenococcaceae cyanobacterium]